MSYNLLIQILNCKPLNGRSQIRRAGGAFGWANGVQGHEVAKIVGQQIKNANINQIKGFHAGESEETKQRITDGFTAKY